MATLAAKALPPHGTAWRALRYFNLYRLTLSGLFIVLLWTENLPPPLGIFDRGLFATVVVVYFLGTVLAQVSVEYHLVRYTAQVHAQVLLDIVAITLMMYASGGVSSGFGMLLAVSIAGAGMLSAGRTAILFAALAALAVLAEEAYSWMFFYLPVANYTHAGLLGATFFATAFLSHVLGRRVRESEALAAQRSADLANLARLNEHIVQRMQSGILVLDEDLKVRLANESALRLTGNTGGLAGRRLDQADGVLAAAVRDWMDAREPSTRLLHPARGEVDVLASFTGLGREPRGGCLVFLEDASMVRQRAQQLKLASLGRLTASIAHEIRNPLGAISHAGQLLTESPALGGEDRRLTQIITEQARRMNAIIENVMRISRRGSAVPESLQLKPWLESFVEELRATRELPPESVTIEVEPEDLRIRMDASQLYQVLWNLCENALRYSRGRPLLELRAGIRAESERPYLEVRDHGPGMSAEVAEHIFEPFFTTDSAGTGLGLYIARELCEANQASLSLATHGAAGCCFRISFAHPARQQAVMP